MTAAFPGKMGEEDTSNGGTKCDFDPDLNNGNRCLGYYAADFSDPDNAVKLAEWIRRLAQDPRNWRDLNETNGSKKLVDRVLDDETLGQNRRPKFGLSSIADARRLRLLDFPSATQTPAGLVIGKFSIGPDQELDKRYGVSGLRTNEMRTRDFFIVIDGYKPVNSEVNKGFQFATWRVFGIEKGKGALPDRLVRVGGNAGAFRWCTMTHDVADQGNGARFIKCEGAIVAQAVSNDTSVSRILRDRPQAEGRSLLDAMDFELSRRAQVMTRTTTEQISSVLRTIFAGLPANGPSSFERVFTPEIIVGILNALDEPENPAWLACGIGCCTADW